MKVRSFWIYTLFVIIFYFLYQMTFTWYSAEGKPTENNEKVVFITIEEEKYGLKRPPFDSLMDSLKIWEMNEKEIKNEKKDVVELKFFESQKPKEQTKVVVIYDKGFDSLNERYAEVINMYHFPYRYYFKEKQLITMHHVNEEGVAYFEYKGKRIKLDPDNRLHDTYMNFSFDEKRLTKTVITNHGFYDKNQFIQMGEEKKKD